MKMKLKYIIYSMAESDKINFDEIAETSLNTLRTTIDGTKCIVKFYKDETGWERIPSFLEGLPQYSHSEIIEIINNPDNGWVNNN